MVLLEFFHACTSVPRRLNIHFEATFAGKFLSDMMSASWRIQKPRKRHMSAAAAFEVYYVRGRPHLFLQVSCPLSFVQSPS